jgi:hypothetical protein
VRCDNASLSVSFHSFADGALSDQKWVSDSAEAWRKLGAAGADGWHREPLVGDYARVACGKRRAVAWRRLSPARVDMAHATANRIHKQKPSTAAPVPQDEKEPPLARTVVVVSVHGVGREVFEDVFPLSAAALRATQNVDNRGLWGGEFRRMVKLLDDPAAAEAVDLAGCVPFRHSVAHCNVSNTHVEKTCVSSFFLRFLFFFGVFSFLFSFFFFLS